MKCTHCNKDLKLKAKLVHESKNGICITTYQWWKCSKCKRVYFGELSEYISDGSYEHSLYKADAGMWREDIKTLRIDPENENFLEHYHERIEHSFEK